VSSDFAWSIEAELLDPAGQALAACPALGSASPVQLSS
jgi:hypothetical protein